MRPPKTRAMSKQNLGGIEGELNRDNRFGELQSR